MLRMPDNERLVWRGRSHARVPGERPGESRGVSWPAAEAGEAAEAGKAAEAGEAAEAGKAAEAAEAGEAAKAGEADQRIAPGRP